jgi:CheY-like chemotaxis protein
LKLNQEPTDLERRWVVLVVEDEAPNRALLRAVLARAQDERLRAAELLEAVDIASARAHLDANAVDVVLLDVRLPDGNGLALAQELRALDDAVRPRVVILSASVLPGDRAAALRSGVDRFLGKPYRPVDLVETLQDLLEPAPDAG